MAGIARSGTAAWVPTGPTMRPFRFGDQHHPDPDPALRPGTMVGDRYRVVQLLGEGGMGRVYEVEHTFLGRRCALKLLRRDALNQPENVRRFQQEAMAASKIGHVSIVEVIDFATLPDGQVFMVMEMLSGESFESWMERPGNLAEILPRLVEVADGLDAAHAAGVLHRDIKPANLFLAKGADGSVHTKILDFGIAKMTDRGANNLQTEAGSVLGTPYYLAPERAMGAAVDARADLYSLGVILYELLTGNVPFEADSFMEILGKHVKTAALDPRQAAPERPIPDRIARLTMQLLAKDPAERPPTAGAVALELSQIAEAEAEALRAVTTGPRSLQSGGADSTRVLEKVGDGSGTVPLTGAPMTAFAGASSSSSSTQVLDQSAAPAQPVAAPDVDVDTDTDTKDRPVAVEPAPHEAAEARSTPTAAILLLAGFALAGAVGGFAYLKLSGGDPAPAAEAAPASPGPRAPEDPVVASPPTPSPATPESQPEAVPEAGGDRPGSPGPGAEAASENEAGGDGPGRAGGDKNPASSGAKKGAGTGKKGKGKGKGRDKSSAADAPKPKPKPDPDTKPPDSGPTIKDDIYD